MRWIHLAQAIQEAYNDFKIDINAKSRQVSLFYYKFPEYEIKLAQEDRTPRHKRKKRVKIQTKLYDSELLD
jgi:hypothetical protein